MASRIRRPQQPTKVGDDRGYISCGGWSRDRHDLRLEQDMDAMLEADVEYFDHPTLGRIRVRDHLVRDDVVCALEGDIEAEQEAGEWP